MEGERFVRVGTYRQVDAIATELTSVYVTNPKGAGGLFTVNMKRLLPGHVLVRFYERTFRYGTTRIKGIFEELPDDYSYVLKLRKSNNFSANGYFFSTKFDPEVGKKGFLAINDDGSLLVHDGFPKRQYFEWADVLEKERTKRDDLYETLRQEADPAKVIATEDSSEYTDLYDLIRKNRY
jgi:hypothetical protein